MKKKSDSKCIYNCTKHLVEDIDILSEIDDYIMDSKKSKNKECIKVFEIIKKDTKKHAELLRDLIEKRSKK